MSDAGEGETALLVKPALLLETLLHKGLAQRATVSRFAAEGIP